MYIPRESLIHSLDPRLKLLGFMGMIISIFAVRGWYGYLTAFLGLIFLIVLSGVALTYLLRSVKSIWFLLFLAFSFQLFSGYGRVLLRAGPFVIHDEGLKMAVEVSLRLVFVVLSASLMTNTTSPIELADALENLVGKIPGMRSRAHELAMIVAISIRFIPVLAEEATHIIHAQLSRGAPIDDRKLSGRIKGMVSIVIPLIISSLRRADEIALAMEARGYRGWQGRTKFRELRWKRRDTVFAFFFVIMMLCILSVP